MGQNISITQYGRTAVHTAVDGKDADAQSPKAVLSIVTNIRYSCTSVPVLHLH